MVILSFDLSLLRHVSGVVHGRIRAVRRTVQTEYPDVHYYTCMKYKRQGITEFLRGAQENCRMLILRTLSWSAGKLSNVNITYIIYKSSLNLKANLWIISLFFCVAISIGELDIFNTRI